MSHDLGTRYRLECAYRIVDAQERFDMRRYTRLVVFALSLMLPVQARTSHAQCNKKLVQDAMTQMSAGKPDA